LPIVRAQASLVVAMRIEALLAASVVAFPVACLAAGGCAGNRPGAEPSTSRAEIPMDIHSHAAPERVRVTHVSLDLVLDFDAKVIRGTAELLLVRSDRTAPLVLDQQGLSIESITGGDGRARVFDVAAEADNLGSAVTVKLEPADELVRVRYATTDKALALQWLGPEQTAGKERPFLFTQGQAVLTRTWIPLQDTPGVRITYDARVVAPPGMRVVMSAEQLGQDSTKNDGAFRFRMTHPIPCYLIALACGDIAFEPISARCGVYAEPSVVKGARDELADMEKMVASAEELFGPYRWGRYDLIVLPPSFPFGGMENPCLTFATPTMLAGDKSLVSLVAHELAHSWSGNLVTNATWRDFWLNEGFTVYFEQRIMEKVYGVERSLMEKQLAKADLEREMLDLEPRDQVLHIDLNGRHPDDGFSGVPYTKGALFLMRLEEVFGRQRLDRFLTAWFDGHPFQSVTTEMFVAFLKADLFASDPAKAAKIDLHAWLDEPGLPADCPSPKSALLARVDREIAAWKQGRKASTLETRGWVTQQWLHFLEGVGDALDGSRMGELDEAFHLTASGNSEILDVWLRLAIQHGYAPADQALERFLMNIGRRKFLEPLYKEMVKTPEGMQRARAIYVRARPRYHAVSAQTIDKILGV
jgi:leukotriene-A4 hydrolase